MNHPNASSSFLGKPRFQVIGQIDPRTGPPAPAIQAAVERSRQTAREIQAISAGQRAAYMRELRRGH